MRRVLIAFLIVFTLNGPAADAYQLNTRWTFTATNGAGLGQGDPTTLTWGIIADGTSIPGEGPSDLINMLDNEFGSSATWMPLFEQGFGRWDELSGLSYAHEPNDDDRNHGSSGGQLGIRPDIRIGGAFYDGQSNVLAYNYFPNNGDMFFDTSDGPNFDSSGNNFRFFRNTLMHEHGHGIGMGHVESSNSRQLLEPFLSTQFDGPQFDDILAAQRGYGDPLEENGGNNTSGTATDFGTIASGSTASIGTNARNTSAVVSSAWTDFVSIDDNSDIDFYSFTVTAPSEIDVTLDPRGPTYNEGPQGGSQSSYNTRALSNLRLRLYDSDGSTILQDLNANPAGAAESISGYEVPAGTYYVRASGAANNVQMYRLDITATDLPSLAGDYDMDGVFDCDDLDPLVAAVAGGATAAQWDMNGDGSVDATDVSEWLAVAGAAQNASGNPYLPGDANLNGVVDIADFNIWNTNKFTSTPAWCSGDFNANGVIDIADFNIWNTHKFSSSNLTFDDGIELSDLNTQSVPEPGSLAILLVGMLGMLRMRRR